MIQLCDYGCGQEAKYQFKNGKWCCSKSHNSCLVKRKKHSIQMKKIYKDPNSIFHSIIYRKNLSNGVKNIWKDSSSIFNSSSYKKKRNKIDIASKLTIEQINKRYSFFSKIEEMRYNPDKPDEKEIQVHCKNHNCENSKEKDGWFTPTYSQIYERMRALEKPHGMIENNFYCSQYCKDTCSLYDLRNDLYEDNNIPYTPGEFYTFRTVVLERDNHICQFCGKPATHVHHERPQKLEPFYALDPDYAWSCCKKCHYEKGHQGECSTGNLSKIVCSVESQKFLNQKI
jgi:hypothetical protein